MARPLNITANQHDGCAAAGDEVTPRPAPKPTALQTLESWQHASGNSISAQSCEQTELAIIGYRLDTGAILPTVQEGHPEPG